MDTHTQLAEELDKALLKVLTEGQTIVDANGTPMTISPTAAMLNVVRGRLKDLNASSIIQQNTPTSDLMERFKNDPNVFRLAQIDDTPDAATA